MRASLDSIIGDVSGGGGEGGEGSGKKARRDEQPPWGGKQTARMSELLEQMQKDVFGCSAKSHLY